MKLKKLLLSTVAVVITLVLAFGNMSYAAGELYVGLSKPNIRPDSGKGYRIGDKDIWNLISYDDVSGSRVKDDTLYCVNAGVGFTYTGSDNIRTYNASYNLKTQKDEIAALSTADYNSVANTEYYYHILWLLDNIYVPGVSTEADRTALLKAAKIDYDIMEEFALFPLTDDEIEVVQQMAIWYYTNYDDIDYHKTPDEFYNQLRFTTNGTTYQTLATYLQNTTGEGPLKAQQMKMLYEYLINEAEENAADYTGTQGQAGAPATVTTTTLGIRENAGNYLVGPINIVENSKLPYTIDITVTNENGNDITEQATFVNAQGEEVESFVGEDFYVQVPSSVGESVKVKIDINYTTSEATLWVSNTSFVEQPVVIIEKKPHTETTELETTAQEKIFDLALRKFITAVSSDNVFENGEYLTNDGTATGAFTRKPNVSYENNQIKYTHTKEPVKVKTGDYIEYTLRIFNEGQLDGYAQEITDYILNNQGLEFAYDHETNLQYGWVMYDANGEETTNPQEAVKIKTNYLAQQETGPARATDNNLLHAFNPEAGITETNPDYRDLKIVFKVTEQSSSKNTLVNIAEISEDADENGEPIDDIDSTPGSDRNNYPEDGYNTENHEDDIDYEPVVLNQFDLSLKKFIAAISSDSVIEEGEYLTSDGTSTGEYTRAPKVTSITNGKVNYDENGKEAVTVKNGDYVLYTIRIYNEGEIDGYASLIRDSIPEGLEFVVEDTTYNGIWTLSEDLTSVTTDNLAKGKGAELGSIEGEGNYTANLLKALQTDQNGNGTVSETSPLNPDYRDVQVLFKVVEPNSSDRVLTNQAQIAEDTDKNGDPIDDIDSTPDEWNEGEDDQDIERVKLQCFDLSLRKFISSVDGVTPEPSREPQVDITYLADGTATTAIYNHTKQPLAVKKGSNITYTIRVYNEGDVDGYASKVEDHLPEWLELVPDSSINTQYGWQESEDGRTISTEYLKDHVIQAFDGTKVYYQDLQIECRVKDTVTTREYITNIAEITEYQDENHEIVNPDRDSTSDSLTDENTESDNLPTDEELPNYKNDEIASGETYIPGQEDDDDFEKVYIQNFDLALRKFITNISGTDVTERVPQVTYEDGKITYTHPKDPMGVVVGDTVTYTIRVYNEGELAGYASEIADDIPEYLTFLPENETNMQYGWTMYDESGNVTENAEEAVEIRTTYLSKENETTPGEFLLQAFDRTAEISEDNPDYLDIKVAFQVKDPNSNTEIITNQAQITDDTDENGNPVVDIDSTPGEWNEGEDDQDIENVKVEYFDLSLLKYVTQVVVTEDGVQKVTETGNVGDENDIIPKVEIHRKKIDSTTVKFVYTIKITNEGNIAGYAKEVSDDIPEGLEFVAEDNPQWTLGEDGWIHTRALENTLLQPGESATVNVTFTWINGDDNLGVKTNTAEITEDYNDKGVPDIDSTPGNKVPGEDDIDIAEVLLSISTGKAQTYFVLGTAVLITLASGIAIIRKFVL